MKLKHKVWTLAFLTAVIALRNTYRFYGQSPMPSGCILLLTAHPDDELMFFAPLLYHTAPYILCLSDGGFEQSGEVRNAELSSICRKLNIQYSILDYKDNEDWPILKIARDLLKQILEKGIEVVVTFDRYGVSGHKNHISCYRAARILEKYFPNLNVSFRYLRTSSIFEKYFFDFHRKTYYLPFGSFFGTFYMFYHRSQMVWYRCIYCFVSNYMSSIYLH